MVTRRRGRKKGEEDGNLMAEKIIDSIRKNRRPTLSFELFPPREERDLERLLGQTLPRLAKLRPDFISVTCSPRGKNCERVAMIADTIEKVHGLRALAHITCQWADREEMRRVLDNLKGLRIANVLAVRGDPIPAEERKSDFPYASRLVSYIRELGHSFCIAVSAYPEGREGGSVEEEVGLLRRKIEAGADFSISQLFLDNDAYLEFVAKVEAAGLNFPVLAGIMPIVTPKARNFARKCSPRIGPGYEALMAEEDPAALREQGIEAAARQAAALLEAGVSGLHWYILNEAEPIEAIIERTRALASS